jgi:hypothetical protein
MPNMFLFVAKPEISALMRTKISAARFCVKTEDNCEDFSGRFRSTKQAHTCIFRLITFDSNELGRVFAEESSKTRRCEKVVCTYTWYIIVSAHAFLQQSVANLPGKYRRTFAFVVGDFVDNFLRCNAWL